MIFITHAMPKALKVDEVVRIGKKPEVATEVAGAGVVGKEATN